MPRHYVEQPRRKTQRVETDKIPFETMEASPPVINLSVGTLLQAKDRIGQWLDAKVVAERGDGDVREVKVHFHGYAKTYDEWIEASGSRLVAAGEQTPDTYMVEQLKGKRKRKGIAEYLCRWAGFGPNDDTWEPEENIADGLIDAYESAQAETKTPRPCEPVEPYVLTQNSFIDDYIADQLCIEWVETVGRKGAALLSHQREEWAAKKFFSMSPCPPWLFCALHRAMRKRGEKLEGVLCIPRNPPACTHAC